MKRIQFKNWTFRQINRKHLKLQIIPKKLID